MIVKNLFLTKQQCKPSVVVILHLNRTTNLLEECEGRNIYRLAHLGMLHGSEYTLTVRFVRSLAILKKFQLNDII